MAEIQNILTPKDFKSDQEVRWCPGCGNHAIMNAIQRALPELGIAKEKFAFISGIGCSSRFPYYMNTYGFHSIHGRASAIASGTKIANPYYMNTYGFHSIHGRASAIASGTKIANPDLCVWQITGDGDAMAIGGNHFIHAIRRNIDLNIILFNNEIYGLTKGQYSPTSKFGAVTKTSPYGTVEHPFHPGELVIGAQGKFFARSIDNNLKLCQEIFVAAGKHHGATVVEVLQNCVIYNDKTHAAISDREHKDDRQIILKHGERMIFGKNHDKGLILDGLKLKVVEIGNKYKEEDILIHDAKELNPGIHQMLANMNYPDYPVAFGVIRNVNAPTYDGSVVKQVEEVKKKSKFKCVDDLLNSGTIWKV